MYPEPSKVLMQHFDKIHHMKLSECPNFNLKFKLISNLDCSDVGAGQGKEITPVLSDDGKESQRPIRSQGRPARNRKKRRLNDLESDSTAAESEDEFMLSNR